jgi:hypothetical protein
VQEVFEEVGHAQWVFVMPKMLRPSVPGVFFEAAAGQGIEVRSMLSKDALRFLPYWGPPGASEPISGIE